MSMNFAHFADFQALSFVGQTIPKKIIIFVGEMNVQGVFLHQTRHSSWRAGRKKAGQWNGQSTLGPMCDAEKEWHERSFCASGAINGCQKSPLDKPEMAFSFFILRPPVTSFNLKASLTLNFLAQNSILYCPLEHHLCIFVISCSNLSETRQCRMQECPAYHDQVVLCCLF